VVIEMMKMIVGIFIGWIGTSFLFWYILPRWVKDELNKEIRKLMENK